jgi:hypothetical protein
MQRQLVYADTCLRFLCQAYVDLEYVRRASILDSPYIRAMWVSKVDARVRRTKNPTHPDRHPAAIPQRDRHSWSKLTAETTIVAAGFSASLRCRRKFLWCFIYCHLICCDDLKQTDLIWGTRCRQPSFCALLPTNWTNTTLIAKLLWCFIYCRLICCDDLKQTDLIWGTRCCQLSFL